VKYKNAMGDHCYNKLSLSGTLKERRKIILFSECPT